MKHINFALALAAGLASSTVAFAQDAPTGATPAQAAAPNAAPASYSDEEIQKYAAAAIAVNKIQADASIAAADKPAKSGEAVVAAGLDAEKFNAMTQALSTSPELTARYQAAATQLQSAPAAAPAAN